MLAMSGASVEPVCGRRIAGLGSPAASLLWPCVMLENNRHVEVREVRNAWHPKVGESPVNPQVSNDHIFMSLRVKLDLTSS